MPGDGWQNAGVSCWIQGEWSFAVVGDLGICDQCVLQVTGRIRCSSPACWGPSHAGSLHELPTVFGHAKCDVLVLLLICRTGLFSEPEHALQLTCSPEAQQLLATWASHLALLNVQPPQLRSMQQTAGQATTSQSTVAGQQQPQPCSESCVSSCSTPDRSARNSCTASGSNTPEQPGSARCRCSSNLQATFHWVAANERRDALVALINSAQAALQKQPLVVCHLSRQTGFLHLLCKEVLSTTASAAQYSCGDAAAAAGAVGQQHGAFAQVKARQDKVQEVSRQALTVQSADSSCLPLNQHWQPRR